MKKMFVTLHSTLSFVLQVDLVHFCYRKDYNQVEVQNSKRANISIGELTERLTIEVILQKEQLYINM